MIATIINIQNFIFSKLNQSSNLSYCFEHLWIHPTNIPLKCKIDLSEKCGDVFIEDSLEGINFICVWLVK